MQTGMRNQWRASKNLTELNKWIQEEEARKGLAMPESIAIYTAGLSIISETL